MKPILEECKNENKTTQTPSPSLPQLENGLTVFLVFNFVNKLAWMFRPGLSFGLDTIFIAEL